MHNLSTVIKFELIRTLKKSTFWASVLAVPLLFAVIAGIVYYSGRTTEQAQEQLKQEPFSLVVHDESGVISPAALETLNAATVSDKQTGISHVRAGKVDAFFYYPPNIGEKPIEVYNRNDGFIDNNKYTTVAETLITNSAASAIQSPALLAALSGNLSTQQVNFEDGQRVNPLSRLIAPAIFLATFYALIVFLGGQMLTSTTEEKENRVTEMLLTSLSSRALIVGKIIALIVLGLIQIAVVLIPVLVVYMTAREALNVPDLADMFGTVEIELWPTLLGAALLISGFLLFTGLLVGIGAAMPTAKEANSFFGFVILIMVVPFWFFSLLMTPTDSPVVTALSYFPPTAPFTLMIRNAFGVLPLHEALIGLTVVTIAGIVAISLAIRIFRYGTLEYGSRLSLKNIFVRKKSAPQPKA